MVPTEVQTSTIQDAVRAALTDPTLGINSTSVGGLLELANRGLAGLPTGNASLSQINDSVDAVNRSFDQCRVLVDCGTNPILADSFNDSFTTRPSLNGLNLTAQSSNLNATKEAGEPDHAGNAGGKSVWWQWTAARSGPVTVKTTGSSFDTLLAVYAGGALSNLVAVASNDDTNAVLSSQAVFNATAGINYNIAVDGYDGDGGSIHLTLIADPPRLCASPIVSTNRVEVCIQGDIGRTYDSEASSDLVNWTLIAAPVNADGTLRFTDLALGNFRQRFYRVEFDP
jgi:hypothetical protein